MNDFDFYESYVKNNLGIPNVNFSKLDIDIVKDIVEALTIVINRYPILKNVICSIGDNNDINNQYNMIINSNKLKKTHWEDLVAENGSVLSTIQVGTHIPVIKNGKLLEIQKFIALAYSKDLINSSIQELNLNAKYSAQYGYHPKNCTSFKSYIYHEIGHVLDTILNLHRDKDLYDICKKHSNNFKEIRSKISLYACAPDLRKIIAEAFSEYIIAPNSNDLINAVGNYIDKKYDIVKDSKILMINKNFSINRK